jgi:hypothetical protein
VVQWSDAQTSYPSPGPSAGLPYAAGTLVAVARDATSGSPLPGEFVYVNGAYAGPRILSDMATLVPDFEANVLVGEAGSQREQPFRAARLALEKAGPGGPNEGFLRPGARLAVVFLSDEDDCTGPSDPSIVDSAGCRAAKAGSLLTPVADVAAFLQGPIAGEVRDVVVAAIVGVAPGTCERVSGGASWTCALSCGQAYCADRTCGSATDEGARFVELLGHFAADHTALASICDASFGAALLGFADVIKPDTVPLAGAPADYQMLVPSIDRPGAGTIACPVALAGTAAADAALSVYTPPQEGRPATVTFQHECAIQRGDVVNVNIICAG